MKKKLLVVLASSLLVGGIASMKSECFIEGNAQIKVMDTVNATTGITYELSEDKTYYIASNKNNEITDVNVVIPEMHNNLPVKEIADEGFADRWWIESISLPKTIEKIGNGAFNGTGLKTVYFNAERCQDFNAKNWIFYPNLNYQQINFIVGKDVKRLPSRLFAPLVTVPTTIPNVIDVVFEEGCAIEEIGDYAFYQLAKIDSLDFPSSLKKIGKYAFYGSGLTSLTLKENLVEIGDHAFDNNAKLSEVTLPSSLKSLGVGAFRYCSSLTKITISSIEEIKKDTFKYCSSLEEVNMVNVKTIGESSFENCVKIKTINYDKVEKIEEKAFKNCSSLSEIVLPVNLKEIGKSSFEDCVNVNKVTISSLELEDLQSSNYTFKNLGKEKEGVNVSIESGVKKIPARLFYSSPLEKEAPKINNVVISSTELTTINENAFKLIDANITYKGKISQLNNIEIKLGNDCFSKVTCIEG